MAYTGQDLIDYEENQYLPLRYYQQNITAPEIMGQTSGITSTAAAQPYVLPGPSTTGGDKGGGFGLFGNLDESNMKMFDKNVFSVDMSRAPPGMEKMTGSFKPQQVQGFLNPASGHYQTFEGKNINHLGLNIKPLFASALESLGGKKKPLFKHDIGDTEGLFTHGTKSGMGKIKEGWDDEKEKWSNALGITKYKAFRKAKKDQRIADEIQAHNKAAADEVFSLNQQQQAASDRSRVDRAYREETGGQAGSYAPGGGSGIHAADKSGSTYSDPFDPGGGEKEGGFIDGSNRRIGYNRGRVVNPGGYAGDTDFTTWLQKQDIDIKTLNLDDLTSLQLEWDKIRPKHLDQADGGRVGFFYGGLAGIL